MIRRPPRSPLFPSPTLFRTPVSRVARRLAVVAEDYGLPLRPERRVGTLSVGERQRVEILRCLLQDPSLIIMDEPTSVLTPDRKSTRLNSSHANISYAVFCLK